MACIVGMTAGGRPIRALRRKYNLYGDRYTLRLRTTDDLLEIHVEMPAGGLKRNEAEAHAGACRRLSLVECLLFAC